MSRRDSDLRIYMNSDGVRCVTLADSERPEDALCDFCSQGAKVLKAYQCRDHIVIEGLPANSIGAWAACPACAEFIDAGDQSGLTDRSLIMFAGGSDVPVEFARETLEVIHKGFFENRITGS